MYPKEYHIQKHEGLEDLGREGAKKKFGKITAWFTEKKTLTSHPIQGGSFFFSYYYNRVSCYYAPCRTEHLI